MGLLRPHRAKLALAALLAVAAGGGWLWLRDSSLVAVQQVRVAGLSGAAAPAIRSSLEQSARSMTTLHVRIDKLRAAVASYTVVKDLKVQTQFPHGLRIDVIEQLPVAALDVGGQRVPVAGNGIVVRGLPAPASVPTLPISRLPTATRVTDRTTLTELTVLDAAPPLLRAHVAQIGYGPRGLTIALRNGPRLFFGDTTLLHAKWDAATRVLAEPSAHGATYIDVRLPGQPTAQVGDTATSGPAAQSPGIVPAGPAGAAGGQAAQATGAGAGAANPSVNGTAAPAGGSAVPPGG
jgi:cell division protein FtsQ